MPWRKYTSEVLGADHKPSRRRSYRAADAKEINFGLRPIFYSGSGGSGRRSRLAGRLLYISILGILDGAQPFEALRGF